MSAYLLIFAATLAQSISSTMSSRARNRSHRTYNVVCSCINHGLWLAVFSSLKNTDITMLLAVPYIIGNVTGNLTGAEISAIIEKKIGAFA